MERVLTTGAAGEIGTGIRRLLVGAYPKLRLFDRRPVADARPEEEAMEGDLTDMAAVERACEGVEGIVHLGGQPVEAPWETILQSNIIGTYNLFEAARRQGVKRVVFATTNHVMGFYRRTETIDTERHVRPDSRYGVSKAFGEAIGSLYADKHGLRVLCIRIGNYGDKPIDKRRLSIWLSPRDMTQLVRIGLDHPDLHYEIVYGMSNNRRAWWDNSNAARLGYRPQDESEPYAEAVLAEEANRPADPVGDLFQGGTFPSAEFSGDLDRL